MGERERERGGGKGGGANQWRPILSFQNMYNEKKYIYKNATHSVLAFYQNKKRGKIALQKRHHHHTTPHRTTSSSTSYDSGGRPRASPASSSGAFYSCAKPPAQVRETWRRNTRTYGLSCHASWPGGPSTPRPSPSGGSIADTRSFCCSCPLRKRKRPISQERPPTPNQQPTNQTKPFAQRPRNVVPANRPTPTPPPFFGAVLVALEKEREKKNIYRLFLVHFSVPSNGISTEMRVESKPVCC